MPEEARQVKVSDFDVQVTRAIHRMGDRLAVFIDAWWYVSGEVLAFSTEMDATMCLIEIIQSLGYTFLLFAPSIRARRENAWMCTIACGGQMATTGGTTMSEAVCRAVINAAR